MEAEITIIGAGVIGLAIAEKLTEEYNDIFLFERHLSFGQESSSRNSEVIHSGIYYTKESLKAKLCVKGKYLLYDYCSNYRIPHDRCGKLIVATSEEEIPYLEEIMDTARENGVDDLQMLGPNEVNDMEPNIFACKALYSPSTGIVDSHLLMKQFETNTINNGGHIIYGSEVKGIERQKDGYRITIIDADKKHYSFSSRIVINSAGLASDKISEMTGIYDNNLSLFFCKGEYFRLRPPGNRLVNRLIYPVPAPNMEGMGIHVTVELGGGVKLGPDVEYLNIKDQDYTLSPSKHNVFYRDAKRFLPFLEYDDITPEMAGIRPKLQDYGETPRDYYIMEESARGFPGFINLIGIESPGLTSSIAIAEYVNDLLRTPI
jgi:L-2-hydroxyglutarate oxidase LhgO